MIEFGHTPEFSGYCPQCGLALYDDNSCPKCKYKKAPRVKNEKKQHGKSNSPNKWYNYEQG